MDLDDVLGQLRATILPSELALIDGIELAGIARSRATATRRAGVSTAVGAVLLGLGSAGLPPEAAVAAAPLSMGSAMSLAPSSLLSYQ